MSEIITFDKYGYNNITLVGRFISALMDVGVVFLVFKTTRFLINNKTALIAAFLYSIFVLPIQLSHFFASDTFVVFFLMSCFYLLLRTVKNDRISLIPYPLAGIAFGLALASKISALYFLPLLLSVFFYLILQNRTREITIGSFTFFTASFLTWRFFDPKTFIPGSIYKIDPRFTANIEQLQSFNDPSSMFPPAVQWIKTVPLFFPLKNMFLWGIGFPLGLLLLISMVYLIYKNTEVLIKSINKKEYKNLLKIDKETYFVLIILFWIVAFFVYQGIQFVKAMRYFNILYPFFALLIASAMVKTINNKKIIAVILVVSLIYPLAFMSIYFNKHTRIQASEWIYENIPVGSTITCEHWDDCLPLNIDNKNHMLYQVEMLELFHPDSPEKWIVINNQLELADYIILSSNRLWGSIPTIPERYPLTAQFYTELLNNDSRFEKIAEFASRPTIPLLGIELIDDHADESFTVYDHPKVMIFKKSF